MPFFKIKNKKNLTKKKTPPEIKCIMGSYDQQTLMNIDKTANGYFLSELVIIFNELTDQEVITLVEHIPENTNLFRIDFSNNAIGKIGAAKLANLPPSITELDLRYNQIDDEGAWFLLENIYLQKLDLSLNKLSWRMNFIVNMIFPEYKVEKPGYAESSLFNLCLFAVKKVIDTEKITQQELLEKLPPEIIEDCKIKRWKLLR